MSPAIQESAPISATAHLCDHRNPFSPAGLRNKDMILLPVHCLQRGQTTTLQLQILARGPQEPHQTGTASSKPRTKSLHLTPCCWHYQPLLTCHFMCFHGEEESRSTQIKTLGIQTHSQGSNNQSQRKTQRCLMPWAGS